MAEGKTKRIQRAVKTLAIAALAIKGRKNQLKKIKNNESNLIFFLKIKYIQGESNNGIDIKYLKIFKMSLR